MLVPAKCPDCGGLVEVDSEKKAAMCQHCGNAFIVEEAVNNFNTTFNITNNYNTTNVTNQNIGEGAVVNIYENKEKDFVIEGGVLKKYCGESLTPVIPEGVVAIAGGVFRDSMITDITLPSTLKDLQIIETDDDYISPFFGCKQLKEIVLPEGLEEISSYAFNKCYGLETIKIPESVKSISVGAYSYCTNLSLIEIPRNTTKIEAGAFQYCNSITSVIIPNDVTIIENCLFSDCTNLTSITIPNGVTNIGDFAFSGCTKLTSINIPNTVTHIGDFAFSGCELLASIEIPDSVTHIGRYTFNGCKNLVSVKKPSNIGSYLFEGTPWHNIATRKERGLCQHCGGSFNGFFSLKCTKCGKPKDY